MALFRDGFFFTIGEKNAHIPLRIDSLAWYKWNYMPSFGMIANQGYKYYTEFLFPSSWYGNKPKIRLAISFPSGFRIAIQISRFHNERNPISIN